MAGIRTLEEVLSRAPHEFDVTVFGAEPYGNYNRIMLSPVLAGEKQFADIVTHESAWYADRGIELIAGEAVVEIDRMAREVRGEHGTSREYDILLLASGSNPVILPIPGAKLPGVLGFRDIADVQTMLSARRPGARAVVIGGGLLGLEAAHGLSRNDIKVTVLHLMPTLMERQLDPVSAELLRAGLETRGISVVTEARTTAIIGETQVRAVALADGRELPTDMVVMAVGIRPNVAPALSAGLDVGHGVKVDDAMRTNDHAIYAVGECIEHRGAVFGLVAPIWEMAKVCADNITGIADARYVPSVSGTRLKVTGIDMFSAGDFLGDDVSEEIVLRDELRGVHRRLVLRRNKLAGLVLYGDTADSGWYFDLLRSNTEITALRDSLIFGPEGSDGAVSGVDALPDTAEICGCNGVSKGSVLAAIAEHRLTTVEGVRARTKACSSCGSCTYQVEALLRCAVGAGCDANPKATPMCKCTMHGHDVVRASIRKRRLKTISMVMRALDWSTPDGCADCRPALNYYLLCAWPGEYRNDIQLRLLNEQMDANVQKDGTYSVVPRLWGGVTSAPELRAIADIVDKYAIPTIKVIGGQRIEMLGVRKEQLSGVWRDLNAAGLVSGHAYGKRLRSVKTCVGSDWCRFCAQDSTSMGIALDKMAWGAWTPHKVTLAVSGCRRNCAEATIKNFGVVAVESGWELHVARNHGTRVRVTDWLAKVSTAEEVLEYCAAFLQLYREDARYLERTVQWVERVGLDFVRGSIVEDPANRMALRDRFLLAQRFSQNDPCAGQAAAPTECFAGLATVG